MIGPHEEIEFDLLDKGEKYVALFYEIIPDECDQYKNMEMFDSFEFSKKATLPGDGATIDIPYVILFRTTHKVEAIRLKELISKKIPHDIDKACEVEREIGLILGYSEESIQCYLKKFKQRKKLV